MDLPPNSNIIGKMSRMLEETLISEMFRVILAIQGAWVISIIERGGRSGILSRMTIYLELSVDH